MNDQYDPWKLSIHKNVTDSPYLFECPFCGRLHRERRYSRYHERTGYFCDCGAHYIIYWQEVKAA